MWFHLFVLAHHLANSIAEHGRWCLLTIRLEWKAADDGAHVSPLRYQGRHEILWTYQGVGGRSRRIIEHAKLTLTHDSRASLARHRVAHRLSLILAQLLVLLVEQLLFLIHLVKLELFEADVTT